MLANELTNAILVPIRKDRKKFVVVVSVLEVSVSILSLAKIRKNAPKIRWKSIIAAYSCAILIDGKAL